MSNTPKILGRTTESPESNHLGWEWPLMLGSVEIRRAMDAVSDVHCIRATNRSLAALCQEPIKESMSQSLRNDKVVSGRIPHVVATRNDLSSSGGGCLEALASTS